MFKVTINKADASEVWELEGKLAGEWVEELRRCWSERDARVPVALQVHLKNVSYVDAAGKELLTQMYGQGVDIRGGGCMTKAVVEEITRQASTNGKFERGLSWPASKS